MKLLCWNNGEDSISGRRDKTNHTFSAKSISETLLLSNHATMLASTIGRRAMRNFEENLNRNNPLSTNVGRKEIL